MARQVLGWLSGKTNGVATLSQLVRYGAVGVATNTAGYFVYLLLTFSGLTPKVTMTMLYCIGATLGFIGNRSYTFRDQGSLSSTGTRYFTAHVGGYLLNLGLLLLFVDWFGLNHRIVQAVAILIVAGFLFVVFKCFVFRTAE